MATRYRWDDFVLDLDSYRLERAGVPLSLEPKAFNLLALMVKRPGHLFTKQEIFEALWADTAVTDHALTRVVAQLRRVLGDDAGAARYLETVPTRGYRWIKTVEPCDPPKRPEASEAAKADRSVEADQHATVAKADHTASRPILPGLTAAFALGVLALVFLVWADTRVPTSAAPEPAIASRDPRWPVQVTTHAGLDMHPALSPQGDAIAFASDRTGAFEIHIHGLGGGSIETPLTTNSAQNVQPAWSPDGRSIAYHSRRDGGIWVISARGGMPRQITAIGGHPAWSPDGRRIAYQSDEHGDVAPNGYSAQAGSTIWIVDADGTHARPVTRTSTPRGGHASPSWSHHGRFLTFSVFEGGSDNGIWMTSVETGETWPIDRSKSWYDPIFARDDSAIYAAGALAVIARFPLDASSGRLRAPREIIPVAGVPGVRSLSISPGGNQLAFAGLSLDSHIWSQRLSPDGSASGPATAITSGTSRRNSLPVVSPDGRKVAYVSTRQGELPNVWMMDIDGSHPTPLTTDEAADHKPTWFPDGKRVAYLSTRGETRGLWAIDLATRREELVFDLAAAEQYSGPRGRLAELQISPSMTRVAFSILTPASGRRGLFVSAAKPFEPKLLTSPDVSAGYPAWSPDEKWIAVEITDGTATHAGVVDAATGSLRRLTSGRGQTWVRSWSPDGTRLAVAVERDGLWSLRWLDAATGKDGALTVASPPAVYLRYPDWSPQGDRVIFERGQIRGNLWTIAVP